LLRAIQVHVTLKYIQGLILNESKTYDTKPKTQNYIVSVSESVWSKVDDSLHKNTEISKLTDTLYNTAYVTRHYIGGNIITPTLIE
jgi:hypothetical protein